MAKKIKQFDHESPEAYVAEAYVSAFNSLLDEARAEVGRRAKSRFIHTFGVAAWKKYINMDIGNIK